MAPPSTGVHASFLAAMKESRSGGRGRAGDGSMLGREIYENAGRWDDPGEFAAYVSRLRADARLDDHRVRRAPAGKSLAGEGEARARSGELFSLSLRWGLGGPSG